MSKKDFSVVLKYVEARPRSQRRKGAEARVSGISVGRGGVSATDLSLLQTNLISVTNNFTALKDLFDSMFEKDFEGNIHAKLSLWSSGGITAGGVGSGGSGGGISYNRLDAWSDYSADKAGYVLSALLGKDLDNRVSALANAGYITASYLAPYALRSEIPSLEPYFLSSNFTKSNIKATLGISDWALASVKPTYTAVEVGALGVDGTAQSALKMTSEYLTDLNNATPWRFFDMNTGYGSTDGNKPNIAWVSGITGTASGSSNYRWQLAMTTGSQHPYFRREHNGNWNNWSTLAFTSDIPTKLSQLTDDIVAGKYLSLAGGTVNGETVLHHSNSLILTIKRTGSGASLIRYNGDEGLRGGIGFGTDGVARIWDNTLSGNYPILTSNNFSQYALPITGGKVNGSITASSFIGNLVGVADKSKVLGDYYGERVTSANLDFTDSAVRKIIATTSMTTAKPPADGSILHFAWDNTGGWNHQLYICSNSLVEPNKRMAWRAQHYGSWSEWESIAFIDSNVASATKLATARYIFGQSFDGTQDITGNERSIGFDSVNAINGDANCWASKYSLKLTSANNAMTFMVDNTENSRKAMIQVGHLAPAYAQYLGNLYLNPLGGNVAIGGKTADEKLHVHGNGKFTGALTANSLTIGGATITYDSANEALCINGNMYALGGITAGGAGISAYTSLESRVARLEQQLNIS